MKRNLLTLAAFGVLTLGAYAGNSGTVVISGSVASKAEISVASATYTLALTEESAHANVQVATVTETCNKSGGYSVEIQSAHLGTGGKARLVHSTDSSEFVDYSITYGSTAVSLDGDAKATVTRAAKTPAAGNPYDFKITYTGKADLAEGSYQDTVTLTLKNN